MRLSSCHRCGRALYPIGGVRFRERRGSRWLGPPDQIVEIGPYRITVQLADWPVEAEVPQPDLEAPDSEPPHPQLAIVHRGRTVAHYPLRRRLTVAGGGRSTLQLADVRVSATHCVLYREADKLWAIDLLSSNGTLLAGRPLQAARVEPGNPWRWETWNWSTCAPRSITRPTAAGKFATLRSWATRAIATTGTKVDPALMDDDLYELSRQVTNRMIEFERCACWRRRRLARSLGYWSYSSWLRRSYSS